VCVCIVPLRGLYVYINQYPRPRSVDGRWIVVAVVVVVVVEGVGRDLLLGA